MLDALRSEAQRAEDLPASCRRAGSERSERQERFFSPERPQGASNAGRRTLGKPPEPKAPRAPTGRAVASAEGASVAPGGAGAEPPPLDTLAQLSQGPAAEDAAKLIRRARAKYITVPLAVGLAELRSPLEKSYRNTVYCSGSLEQDANGRLKGKYCGNRWCLVCNRVRVARAINRYLPEIASWTEPQLVTLTLPNVLAHELAATIDLMVGDLVAIGRAIRRTDRLALRALRKLECTYNPERDDYHPHFHLAVEGQPAAEALRTRWLAIYPDASPAAQDIRPCDGRSLKELFKYFTKLLAKRPDSHTPRAVASAVALDVIFSAMKGRRVYQPMGFRVTTSLGGDENAKVGAAGDTLAVKRVGERVLWAWMQEFHDWVDLETGDLLTGYEPTDAFRDLVRNIK